MGTSDDAFLRDFEGSFDNILKFLRNKPQALPEEIIHWLADMTRQPITVIDSNGQFKKYGRMKETVSKKCEK